jgi:hypothetical protein
MTCGPYNGVPIVLSLRGHQPYPPRQAIRYNRMEVYRPDQVAYFYDCSLRGRCGLLTQSQLTAQFGP